jgi:hypothetical protein
MNALKAHVKNGRLILDEPTVLPRVPKSVSGSSRAMTLMPRIARRFTRRFSTASRMRKPAEPSTPSNGPSSYAPGCEDPSFCSRSSRGEPWRGLVARESPEAVRFEAPVRRILMPKAEAHVCHATIDDEVIILAVWGARRRRGPKL